MVRGIKWESRRWASRLVRALVFILPLAVGVIAATLVARTIPGYDSFLGGLAWWTVVLASSFVAVNLTDRLARKFLPLAALLDMSLVFPGTAPSRVKIAMRTWTTAQLQRRVVEARDRGIDDDPTRAGETVLLLVAALNAHDHVTRGHAERTRAFTDVLADELGVPLDQREKLRWVALLHDVGKLRIEESILNKDQKLDDAEWDAVRRHPELGDQLIAPIKEFLAPWGDTILHHHERWDGAGYPLGLSGEGINLGARIVAVADAYDAMTARRSYQPAKSPREALRELGRCAGTQFDPAVVRAFLGISAKRMRRLTGPLAMMAQVPLVAGFQRVAEWAGTAVAGTAVVVSAVASGFIAPEPISEPVDSAPVENVAQAAPTEPVSTTTTTVPPATTTTRAPASTTTTTLPPATTTTTTTTTTTAAPGSPPTAVNDAVSGSADRTFVIQVLANDSDPDGDPLTVMSCSVSAQGAATTVVDNKCKYTHPDPGNWTVPDTFTYTISDGNGGTATATVTVTPE